MAARQVTRQFRSLASILPSRAAIAVLPARSSAFLPRRFASNEPPSFSESVSSAIQSEGRESSSQAAAGNEDVPDVFVGRLPYQVDQRELAEAFSEFGEVLSARIIVDRDGNSKGFGYLKFADRETVDRVVEADGRKTVGGRAVRIDVSQGIRPRSVGRNLYSDTPRPPPTDIPPSEIVYLGNIPYEATESDIREAVVDCRAVRIPILDTGRGRGFAYVEMSSTEDAKTFVDKAHSEGFHLGGRAVRVGYAVAPRLNNSRRSSTDATDGGEDFPTRGSGRSHSPRSSGFPR